MNGVSTLAAYPSLERLSKRCFVQLGSNSPVNMEEGTRARDSSALSDCTFPCHLSYFDKLGLLTHGLTIIGNGAVFLSQFICLIVEYGGFRPGENGGYVQNYWTANISKFDL